MQSIECIVVLDLVSVLTITVEVLIGLGLSLTVLCLDTKTVQVI